MHVPKDHSFPILHINNNLVEQIIKTFSVRKLVPYKRSQQWCKKGGNKGLIKREDIIVLYFAHKIMFYKWVRYRTLHFPFNLTLVSSLFTLLLTSYPIYHQLSHRECFYYLFRVYLIFS